MNRILLTTCTAVMFTAISFAQTSAEAQGGASASQSLSVSANRTGADANSHTAAGAATQGSLTSQTGSHSADAAASNQLATGSTIHASLVKPIDAGKCKPGDEVVAKTTENVKSDGKVIVPKGSRIVGHVTEAKARTKEESGSAVGIAFDHAVLKNGSQVPLSASIQTIARADQSSAAALDSAPAMTGESEGGMVAGGGRVASGGALGGGGHVVGGVASPVAGTVTHVSSTAGQTLHGAGSAGSAVGGVSSSSNGVVGFKGLALTSTAANSTQGSLITSTNRNVNLDSGTQMVLQVMGK